MQTNFKIYPLMHQSSAGPCLGFRKKLQIFYIKLEQNFDLEKVIYHTPQIWCGCHCSKVSIERHCREVSANSKTSKSYHKSIEASCVSQRRLLTSVMTLFNVTESLLIVIDIMLLKIDPKVLLVTQLNHNEKVEGLWI